jgi:hypothetical protein
MLNYFFLKFLARITTQSIMSLVRDNLTFNIELYDTYLEH